jgi:hypothetical protein
LPGAVHKSKWEGTTTSYFSSHSGKEIIINFMRHPDLTISPSVTIAIEVLNNMGE